MGSVPSQEFGIQPFPGIWDLALLRNLGSSPSWEFRIYPFLEIWDPAFPGIWDLAFLGNQDAAFPGIWDPGLHGNLESIPPQEFGTQRSWEFGIQHSWEFGIHHSRNSCIPRDLGTVQNRTRNPRKNPGCSKNFPFLWDPNPNPNPKSRSQIPGSPPGSWSGSGSSGSFQCPFPAPLPPLPTENRALRIPKKTNPRKKKKLGKIQEFSPAPGNKTDNQKRD